MTKKDLENRFPGPSFTFSRGRRDDESVCVLSAGCVWVLSPLLHGTGFTFLGGRHPSLQQQRRQRQEAAKPALTVFATILKRMVGPRGTLAPCLY